MAVDPNEAPPGYKATPAYEACKGCAFKREVPLESVPFWSARRDCKLPICRGGDTCLASERKDGEEVIFIHRIEGQEYHGECVDDVGYSVTEDDGRQAVHIGEAVDEVMEELKRMLTPPVAAALIELKKRMRIGVDVQDAIFTTSRDHNVSPAILRNAYTGGFKTPQPPLED